MLPVLVPRILAAFERHGALSAAELVALLADMHPDGVYNTLTMLVRAGALIRTGYGRYRISTPATKPKPIPNSRQPLERLMAGR